MPLLGVPAGILQLWCAETRMVRLSDCEKISKICLLVSTEYTSIADTQTDATDTTFGV